MISKEQNTFVIVGAFDELMAGSPTNRPNMMTNIQVIVARGGGKLAEVVDYFEHAAHKPKPLIAIRPHPKDDNMPLIGLIAQCYGKWTAFEQCYPWMDPKSEKVSLIPSDFRWGSYHLDDDLGLVHEQQPSKPDYGAAREGIIAAYERFNQLQIDRFEDMEAF
jgi:hypothetical protein